MFIGGRPTTAEESLKKLQIATGIASPSDFARNSRNSRRLPPASGHSTVQLMEPGTAVKNIFQDRYLVHGASKVSIDNVDKLIKEIAPISNDSSGSTQQLTAASGLRSIRHRWYNTHCLGALQLLAAIKQGLYTEEPRLQYNYFGMHKRGVEILRRIQKKEDHKLRQYFGPEYMSDVTMISDLVIMVLEVARGSGAASQQLGLSQAAGGSSNVGSRILTSCERYAAVFERKRR